MTTKFKIYVASSWRNFRQIEVVKALKNDGHDVYDFRNPSEGNRGFQWTDIDPDWQYWSMEQYLEALANPIAIDAFMADYTAMKNADIFVGVSPFGVSASIEMGWAAGKEKTTILMVNNIDFRPELMTLFFGSIVSTESELIAVIRRMGTTE